VIFFVYYVCLFLFYCAYFYIFALHVHVQSKMVAVTATPAQVEVFLARCYALDRRVAALVVFVSSPAAPSTQDALVLFTSTTVLCVVQQIDSSSDLY